MSGLADNETLRFYDQEAKRYCQRTGGVSSPLLREFLARLKSGAFVLELGCGSGRDTIEMLRLGYNVNATDGSPEMARQAEDRLKHPVSILEFGQIEGEARFAGVWACACLLHIPLGDLGEVLSRIYRVLDSPGVLFANFKEGTVEGRDRLGRYYNYPSLPVLKEIFQQAAPWISLEIERSSGVGYDDIPVRWLNCFATK